MKVKTIMIPFPELKSVSVDNTLREALQIIEDNQLFSMPVVDGKKFIGVLSKRYVYETYFKEFEGTKEEFLDKKVIELMKTRLETISVEKPIEEAALMFINSKVRFIPVTNEKEELVGIVTQQAIFKQYQKIFGSKKDTFVVVTYDFKGVLARISEIIARHGGNIKNIVQIDTETIGLQEIFITVEGKDFDKVVKALIKNGFDVRLSEAK
ncbi:MAG: CBS domain-containing protein [Lachnospiraceae bacterium]|uniref:CBS domain-containing protein n=1 Tax=Falcatimonas sp. MSJ-15 TaxID=2841515 RepID=UPI001C10529D|nr:CBS domain-containing protein [Falcatimonas sp. MSJ-15]MBQ5735412.1 CBS domain-containing protein [Lachnospiraceae bacterium]MBU5470080.1 CBS domain-containing protein [Falcatimonas sp. MSJ-15]MEE0960496.1 CBS domain-containing protein [Lachnospiraceae bacterium]